MYVCSMQKYFVLQKVSNQVTLIKPGEALL